MRVDNEHATFNIFKTIEFSYEVYYCFQTSDIDVVVVETYMVGFLKLSLKVSFSTTLESVNKKVRKYVRYLEVAPSFHPSIKQIFKELDTSM